MSARCCASIVVMALYLGWGSCPGLAQTGDGAPPTYDALPTERAWLARLPASPTAAGVFDDDRVYVPVPGQLVALDRSTGRTVWTAAVDTAWPPVVAGTSLWVATDADVLELDPEDGARRHAVVLAAPLSAPMTMAPPYLVLPTADGSLSAVRMPERQVQWRVTTGSVSRVGVAAAGAEAVVVALEDARVLAIALADGRTRWSRTLTGTLGAPVAASDRVFVGSSDNALYALEAETGEVAWRRTTGGDVLGIVADGRTVYVVSLDHVILALDPGSGNQRWRQVASTRPVAAPRLLDRVLVVTGLHPAVTGYATGNGASAGTLVFEGEVDPSARAAGPPLVARATDQAAAVMVVITRDGQVLGVRPVTKAESPPASP